MRSLLSLPAAPGIPRFAGPSPKEEGDSKKRLHTHDANGYQATNKRSLFCKYLVYQVLSGLSVSQGTLCPMTLLAALEDERMPVWDVGRRARQRGRGNSI